MKNLRRCTTGLLMAPVVLVLSSCMIMRTAEKGYLPVRLVQDGTAYEAVLVAEGEGPGLAVSAMIVAGGSVNVFGPYRFEMMAYGFEGNHRTLEVRRFRFRFANGQTFDLGPEYLKGSPIFVAGEYRGEVVALRRSWKIFQANPQADGPVRVEVDAIITSANGRRPVTLKFNFTPTDSVKVESINVPWEIKKSIWKEDREHPVSAWRSGLSS